MLSRTLCFSRHLGLLGYSSVFAAVVLILNSATAPLWLTLDALQIASVMFSNTPFEELVFMVNSPGLKGGIPDCLFHGHFVFV